MSRLSMVNVNPIGPSHGLRLLFERAAQGPLPDWDVLELAASVCALEPGDLVFDQGVEHPHLYVVRSGLLKACYLMEDGTEWVKAVAYEGLVVASLTAFHEGGRTGFAVQAMEPSVLERVPYRVVRDLAQKHTAWALAIARLALEYVERRDQREWELLTLTPRARYQALVEKQPELIRRVPQKYLARMLGMTPVGLNRIVMRERRQNHKGAQGPGA